MTVNNELQEAAVNPAKVRVTTFKVHMPKWLQVLDAKHEIITSAAEVLKKFTENVKFVRDNKPAKVFDGNEYFQKLETVDVNHEKGEITYEIVPHENLYYQVLSGMAEAPITNERELVAYVAALSSAKREYDKLRSALEQVEQTGYGVVIPTWESFKLEEPVLHQSGKNCGIKFRAGAYSLHIVRVDIKSEVTPTIGSQQQSEEMLKFLKTEYETSPQTVWNTPIFGKSLESIVREDISNKSLSMPVMAQTKMRRTLTKIVNNGKGGVICILL